jgi:hypothetical protein
LQTSAIEIHGIGVFAVRDIPKGKNPFRTLPKYNAVGYMRITEEVRAQHRGEACAKGMVTRQSGTLRVGVAAHFSACPI